MKRQARGLVGRRVSYKGAEGVVTGVLHGGALLRLQLGAAKILAPKRDVRFLREDYAVIS